MGQSNQIVPSLRRFALWVCTLARCDGNPNTSRRAAAKWADRRYEVIWFAIRCLERQNLDSLAGRVA